MHHDVRGPLGPWVWGTERFPDFGDGPPPGFALDTGRDLTLRGTACIALQALAV